MSLVTNIAERTKIEWRFWLLWVLATWLGLFLAFAMQSYFTFFPPETVIEELAINFMGGMQFAVPLAIAQWLVLRGRVSGAEWWIPGTIMAASLAFPLARAITLIAAEIWPATYLVDPLMSNTLFGAFLGTSQWLILRRQVSKSGWWVMASAAGMSLLTILVGFPYAAITGGVLVWLFPKPISSPHEVGRADVGTDTSRWREITNNFEQSVRRWITVDPESLDWGFWRKWAILTGLGLFLGVIARFTLSVSGLEFLGVAASGASFGWAQWLVLRQLITRAGWWVLASAVGAQLAGSLAIELMLFGGGTAFSNAAGGTVLGASVGIGQWLVLRRHVRRAIWWVPASTLGGAAGAGLGLGFFVFWPLAVAAVYGAVTGTALVWLLRQPAANEPSLPQDAG